MEEKLSIKVTVGDISIELKGNTKIVLDKFDEIRTNGLGKIVSTTKTPIKKENPKAALTKKENPSAEVQKKVTEKLENTSLPSLRDINMKGLPKKETEWIIIYGFYSGDFGKKEFTRDELIQQYKETKRWTTSRKANLTNNLKSLLKQNKIRFLNDHDIVLDDDGIANAKEILTR
jgi:hypothetical protein